jgi:hypothetical protein
LYVKNGTNKTLGALYKVKKEKGKRKKEKGKRKKEKLV